MDEKLQMLLEKAKIYAGKTGQAAESAGRKATELAQATRINLQIFDLNTECEVLYKEIGKLMYDVHQGIEADEEGIQERLVKLDERHEKIAALREQISLTRSSVRCPNCGKVCSRTDAFCAACGGALGTVVSFTEDTPEEAVSAEEDAAEVKEAVPAAEEPAEGKATASASEPSAEA